MSRLRKDLRRKLHDLQSGCCCYCRRPIQLAPEPWGIGNKAPDDFATLEHLRRKADGGLSTPDNLALACNHCNSARGALSWVEFATAMMPIPSKPEAA